MMWTKFLLTFLGLIVGILLGFNFYHFLYNWNEFQFSPEVGFEINPLGFINLIATIGLAYYVTRILSRKNSKEKLDVDLARDYFLNFRDDIKSRFSNLSEAQEVELTRLTSDCKIIRMRIHSICSSCEESGFVGKDDPKIKDLLESVKNVWELLTDTPKKIDGRGN